MVFTPAPMLISWLAMITDLGHDIRRQLQNAFALTQHFCYRTRTVASSKLLLWLSEKQSARGAPMSNVLLPMDTRRQLLRALKTRYQSASKAEKTRILEGFILISGYHRKSAIRLLNEAVTSGNHRRRSAPARSVYGAVVQQDLIVIWEASDRLCGKRLRALLHQLISAMERHGHLCLNPALRGNL
ncbi:hypothetical protein GTD56_004196 [Salmonella enterica subsp. diarizonae]|nr:hypothetical protein [Salmonella enterica subsp. diarizonae]